MKKIILKSIIGAFSVAFMMSSCMNLEPLDPNQTQMNSENQQQIIDALYYKLYASFVLTGQNMTDGGGDADIITDDEGYSGFFRTLTVLNEFPTDAGWWVWRGNAGCSDLLMLSWTTTNPFTSKLYNRLNYGVTMSNHFLDLTEGASDEQTIHRRAEVRFIRAINYYHLLDMFGNVPFTVTISNDNPHQIKRADLYEWLVDEIINGHSGKTYNVESYKVIGDATHGLVDDLYSRDETTIYRVNKSAAYMLLARLYLNAEIYSGTAHWSEAEEAAREVLKDFPTLHPNYAQIFMGDNDQVAREELVFVGACDGANMRSYAATQYMIASCRNSKMNEIGTYDNNWGCWRSSPELIAKFGIFQGKTPTEIAALGGQYDEFAMPTIVGDDRAMFCAQNINPTDGTLNIKGFCGNCPVDGLEFDSCWAICKWTNKYSIEFDSNNQPIAIDFAPQHDAKYTDTDLPLMRTAEAYLTLAEALYRQGKSEALDYINAVRNRAHATPFTAADLTDDNILDEWLREFYHEGRRRIDLIRFGQFVGPNVTRTWEGRSGNSNSVYKSFESNSDGTKGDWNTEIVDIDITRILYPIPETDVISNPHITQNPGY